MKMVFGFLAGALFYSTVSLASPVYHVSSMTDDPQINSALYRALKEGYKKVAGIQNNGSEYMIQFNNDKLTCSDSGCRLVWDAKSPSSVGDSAKFQEALLDTVMLWAQNGGKDEPSLHFVTFKETGNIQVTISEGGSAADNVDCLILNARSSMPTKQCSLNVSETFFGTGSETKAVYQSLINAKSNFDEQKNALLKTLRSDRFLPVDQFRFGNGSYQVIHSVYTDLLIDGLTVSAFYGYKVPLKNRAGQTISNGIELTITGSLLSSAKVTAQEIKAQSYALAHRSFSPAVANTNRRQ